MELTILHEIRKQKKVSIKELASRTGINRDRISLIERGLVNPSFDTVQKIVDALGFEIKLILK